jgi:glycosyltransferase involved in cell wall biosynthesis
MRFTTLFPEAENVHLIKSCGMIPFILYKDYGYDSTIACYNNGEYPYLDNAVKGLKMDHIKRVTNNKVIDSCLYLMKYAKKIDVLHLYHLSKRSVICSFIYKMFNPKGIVYLKLDSTDKDLLGEKFDNKNLKLRLKLLVMKVFNIISTESSVAREYINTNFPVQFEYIQNGFNEKNKPQLNRNRDNIILTVSRIGVEQKANEVMLEGFALASPHLPNWKLRLVGPIADDFKGYIEKYFEKYPHLKDKVEFLGPITDREKLNEEYNNAKVFTLTSVYEGFPTVFLEAIKSGCYLVTTNFNVAQEITKYGELGTVVDIGDYEGYSKALISVCSDEEKLLRIHPKIQDFAYENYYWPKTGSKLDSLIRNVKF